MTLMKLDRGEIANPADVYLNLDHVSYLIEGSRSGSGEGPYQCTVGLSGTVSFAITKEAFEKIRAAMGSR